MKRTWFTDLFTSTFHILLSLTFFLTWANCSRTIYNKGPINRYWILSSSDSHLIYYYKTSFNQSFIALAYSNPTQDNSSLLSTSSIRMCASTQKVCKFNFLPQCCTSDHIHPVFCCYTSTKKEHFSYLWPTDWEGEDIFAHVHMYIDVDTVLQSSTRKTNFEFTTVLSLLYFYK